MIYSDELNYHFRTKMGWMNDPNGLVYFNGYYHVFCQYSPDYEYYCGQPMHWAHARTKDFINWEELPIAISPDKPYDEGGCWSGTAIVKDNTLYLFYASVIKNKESKTRVETVSMAYSTDGINFTKYDGNPIIDHYPPDGGSDFRDPAVAFINGKYYIVMATGHAETQKARLLLYQSEDLVSWEYKGIMAEWDNCKYAECPSFMKTQYGYLLTASVCPLDATPYFSVMFGDFSDGIFSIKYSSEVDKGPDQYAGQVFLDHLGRALLITWIPGWKYNGYADKNLGCMSIPREIILKDGKIHAYPAKEVQHLLKDSDPSVKLTENGFTVERSNRDPLVYTGKISDLKIIRDEQIVEIFVNGGEEVFAVLL